MPCLQLWASMFVALTDGTTMDMDKAISGQGEHPNTIRDLNHLEELLLEGFKGQARKVTEDSWDEIRWDVRKRHATADVIERKRR